MLKPCLHSTPTKQKDAMTSACLDRKEAQGAIWGVHSTGPAGQYAYIQGDFFCHMAGRSAPTGLAIVHWIGCINAIKSQISNLRVVISSLLLGV